MRPRTRPARAVAPTRGVALAAAAVLAGTLTSCVPATGPLTGLNAHTIQCVGDPAMDDVTFGFVFENTGASPAEIRDLAFDSLDGVTVTGSWIAEQDRVGDEWHGYGVGPYPPDEEYHPGWPDRVDAVGATIPGEHETFLVVRLQRDGELAAGAPHLAVGPRLTYSVDRHDYVATSDAIVGFELDGDCDPSD